MPLYFGPDVDVKIEQYCLETDFSKKNEIFESGIKQALMKLIDSQLYLYGFYKIGDPDTLKSECLSSLYETLHKFDATKGTKAFSYFNVVTRNWFVGRIRDNKKKLQQQTDKFYGIDHDVVKTNPSMLLQSYEDDVIEKEFWVSLFKNMDRWRQLLKKKQELQVLDAITFLLQNTHLISIYNKKAVFLYIREITGLTMKQVNHNITRLKKFYADFKEKFHSGEEDRY